MACRRHHCLQTLFLLFEFETKDSLVSGANALLVGALLISKGDDTVIKAIVHDCFYIIDQTEENFAGGNIITAHA